MNRQNNTQTTVDDKRTCYVGGKSNAYATGNYSRIGGSVQYDRL